MSNNTGNKILPRLLYEFEHHVKNDDPFYSKENMEILHKSLEDYKNGKMTFHELVEA